MAVDDLGECGGDEVAVLPILLVVALRSVPVLGAEPQPRRVGHLGCDSIGIFGVSPNES